MSYKYKCRMKAITLNAFRHDFLTNLYREIYRVKQDIKSLIYQNKNISNGWRSFQGSLVIYCG